MFFSFPLGGSAAAAPAAPAASTAPVAPGAASAVRHHAVVEGDTLWGLAGRYYKDPFKWEIIFKANEPMIHYPHWIYPGEDLVIPGLPPPLPPPVPAAAPVRAQVETPAPPPPPKPAPPAPLPKPLPAAKELLSSASVSESLPPGLPGSTPSEPRLRLPRRWVPEAKIPDRWPAGDSLAAAPGHPFEAKFSRKALPFEATARFAILRVDARREDDPPGSRYVRLIGTASIYRRLGSRLYEMRVLRSVDTVQGGDFVSSALPDGKPVP